MKTDFDEVHREDSILSRGDVALAERVFRAPAIDDEDIDTHALNFNYE